MSMQKSNFFNPQDAAKQIMNLSFLKSRGQLRQTGSKFFQDNKIRSCSYVKQVKDGIMKAVPFYQKRNTTVFPTKSDFTRSWSSRIYSDPKQLNAGMGTKKPLITYDPNNQRNLINIPDFIPNHPNNSYNLKIGDRNNKDVKHYLTNYGNSHSFVHESRRLQSNNPAITAFRNKWIRSRLEK